MITIRPRLPRLARLDTGTTIRWVSSRRHDRGGSITVLAAYTLLAIVLLGMLAWAGLQEWADHTLLGRIAADAVYDASGRTTDAALVAGTPALACADPTCAPTTCPTALARDPDAATAAGAACRALRRDLEASYGGAHARLDVAATLAATRAWTLAPGARDPENPSRTYHHPTVCLALDTTVGVVAHDGLGMHQRLYACAQVVSR